MPQAHQLACRLAARLVSGQHYQFDPSVGSVQTHRRGHRSHSRRGSRRPDLGPVAHLDRVRRKGLARRTVLSPRRALCGHRRSRPDRRCQYGRIFSDRTWQDGLHQAIEAKEACADHGRETRPGADYASAFLPPLPAAVRNDRHGRRLRTGIPPGVWTQGPIGSVARAMSSKDPAAPFLRQRELPNGRRWPRASSKCMRRAGPF